MYFKVYHKASKQPLATFNEKHIVDFCLSNKETIKNYYFSTGEKELMEWEVFAAKYTELFTKKAKERQEAENKIADSVVIEVQSKKPMKIAVIIAILLILVLGGYFVYYKAMGKDANITIHTMTEEESKALDQNAEKPVKPKEVFPMKRTETPDDSKLTAITPKQSDMEAIWKKTKAKLTDSLSSQEIKDEMDKYLPDLKTCYEDRIKAGDKDMRGTINMKIRVTGDGAVHDVLFTDDKFRATLFGDCISKAVKAKPFKVFKSKSQVFTYYYNL